MNNRSSPTVQPPADPVCDGYADGRHGRRAGELVRGVSRLLRAHGLECLAEVPLPNDRRADLMGLSRKGVIWIVEIKSGLADFRADDKWPDYRDFCDQFYFAIGPDFPLDALPDDTGIIVADRYGGEILAPARPSSLAAARRRAMTLRFARLGAARLLDLLDPEAGLEPGRR